MQSSGRDLRFWATLGAVYAVLVVLPHLLSFSQKEVAVFLVINVLVVVSYRLLTLTGEWSLAHVVIMGVGAYASTLLAKRLGIPVPPAMLLGAGVAALTAYILSFPLLRMKAFYFLIGSFAAGEVIRLCWKRFREPFGGPKGLKLIPSVPDIEIGGLQVMFFDPVNYYYLCLIVVSVSLFILYRVEKSRIGLTFHAIHWQDRLAEAVGVDTRRYRTLAFVIASFFAGLAGALLAHYLGTVNPNQFDVEAMVYVLVWVIVGGTATIYGPILGVVALTVINEIVLREAGRGPGAAAHLRSDPDRVDPVPAGRAGEPGAEGEAGAGAGPGAGGGGGVGVSHRRLVPIPHSAHHSVRKCTCEPGGLAMRAAIDRSRELVHASRPSRPAGGYRPGGRGYRALHRMYGRRRLRRRCPDAGCGRTQVRDHRRGAEPSAPIPPGTCGADSPLSPDHWIFATC